jgi:hypothetical protein
MTTQFEYPQTMLRAHAGLGRAPTGLGIPGPYGQVPSQVIPAGTYEISGTDVAFRAQPNLSDPNPPRTAILDQIETDGQTANTSGYTWVHGKMKTGPLAGQVGYVAALYLAPLGWTQAHGGGGGGSGGGSTIQPVTFVTPVSKTTTTTTTTIEKSWFEDNWPYVVGALAVGALGFALFGTRKGKAVRRLARAKARKYRHRRKR